MRVGRERLKKILAIIGDMYPEARGELECHFNCLSR